MPRKFIFLILILIVARIAWVQTMQWHLPENWISKSVLITGTVASIPVQKYFGVSFRFDTAEINHQKIHTTLLLNARTRLHVGDHATFIAKLKPPIGSRNPGGFDYERFLQSQGITATGFVKKQIPENVAQAVGEYANMPALLRKVSSPENCTLQSSEALACWRTRQLPARNITNLRASIADEINAVVPNNAIAGFISALSVGIRTNLTEKDWEIFRNTGTNHLVAIAGLHIGFVFLVCYWIARWGWSRSEKLLFIIPAQRIAAIFAFTISFFYASLSGFAIPAQRAMIMLTFFIVSEILYRPISLFYRWLYAVLLIWFLNPYCIFDGSFWLSVTSIAILGFILHCEKKPSPKIKTWFSMQIAIIVGLTPLLFFYFQQISLISFFTNFIAIPWVGFLILPVCLLATVFCCLHVYAISKILFVSAYYLLIPLWHFLSWSAQLPLSSVIHAVYSPWILFAGMIGIFFLLAPKKFPGKYLGACGLLPLFFYTPALPPHGAFWVNVIDVGQGLSVLIRTQHHVMLYDTGAHYPHGFDYGESVVTPFLRYENIAHIDRLEISHGDNDHSGGMAAILKNFSVDGVWTSAPTLVNRFHAQYCAAEQTWRWDGVTFDTLHPIANRDYQDNNSSCVIHITNGHTSLLLTGDIERDAEYALADADRAALASTVLLVPHHGSKTSSSAMFLNAVAPDIAIVSAGRENRYHLPALSIVRKYEDRQIALYNTAIDGEISIRFDEQAQVKSSHAK